MNGTRKHYAQPGSVSTATMREQDLIPAFIAVLPPGPRDGQRDGYEQRWALIQADTSTHKQDDTDWLLEDLFDALGDLAPPGHYFGASEGDGADYGFWRSDEFDPDLYYTVRYGNGDEVVYCGDCIESTAREPHDDAISDIDAFGKCATCERVDEPCSACQCTSHEDAVAHGEPDPYDVYGTEEHEALLRSEEHA